MSSSGVPGAPVQPWGEEGSGLQEGDILTPPVPGQWGSATFRNLNPVFLIVGKLDSGQQYVDSLDNELSGQRTVWIMDCLDSGLSRQRTVWTADCLDRGLSGQRTVKTVDCGQWTVWPVDCLDSGLRTWTTQAISCRFWAYFGLLQAI